MTTGLIDNKVKEIHQKLTDCLCGVRLGVAGRVLYYDPEQQVFILAVHATGPEKTQEAASLAWDSIPEDLKTELQEAGIGFAGKQI